MLALFLDGFDEIDHDSKRKKAKEILDLAGRYGESIVFVSSRPDESFASWDIFSVYKVCPLSKDQARLLVEKIPYDCEIKANFIRKLDSGLYDAHRGFLVNPLLVLMMLITFEQFAEIPAKIHLFYEYAFEALFVKHDASKRGGFIRRRRINLALDDYRRLFSYFCVISYMSESFTFTQAAALEVMGNSILASQIEAKKEDMIEDLASCTCVLVQDGLDLTFSHRSFHEYFVAYFFARVKTDEFSKVASKLILRTGDSVFLMMSEMNNEVFEEHWALPELDRMCGSVADIDPQLNPIKFFEAIMVQDIMIDVSKYDNGNGKITFVFTEDNLYGLLVRAKLYNIYGMFDHVFDDDTESYEDTVLVDKILSGELPVAGGVKGRDSCTFIPAEKDEEWFRSTSVGRGAIAEKNELIKLRNIVKNRVEKRKNGIKFILGL
jgi:hypothetical protein